MEENRNFEHQVEKTMQALDGMERATTDDFFYARLEARLAEREGSQHPIFARLSPGWATAAAALFLLILFNILTVLHYNQQYEDSDATRQQNLEALAEEYYLEVPLIYELESNE